jgi:holo-[acyl-carrier protein] synthase
MITGVGIDIVNVRRMERWLINSRLLERYFHPDEIVYILSRGNGASMSLAARFAAKEAFGKALGTGFSNITLKDIAVYNKYNGKPRIKLFGTALRALEKSGANKVFVSFAHEKENAIAVVVLEGA